MYSLFGLLNRSYVRGSANKIDFRNETSSKFMSLFSPFDLSKYFSFMGLLKRQVIKPVIDVKRSKMQVSIRLVTVKMIQNMKRFDREILWTEFCKGNQQEAPDGKGK